MSRRSDHVTTKSVNRENAAILNQSKFPVVLETRDLLFARVLDGGHFECREFKDAGDETASCCATT